MFGLSGGHLLVIGVLALLLFGNRLPEVARALGRSFNEFKRGLRDVQDEFSREEDKSGDDAKPKLRQPTSSEGDDPRVARESRPRESERVE